MSKKEKSIYSGQFSNVLVVQISTVTNLVCMSSLVHDLKESSGAHLALVVRPSWAQMAASIPGVDEVIQTKKNGTKLSLIEVLRLVTLLRRKKFDVLISPDSSGRLALLAGLSGIDVRIGYRLGLGQMFYNYKVSPDSRELCRQVRDQDLLKVLGIQPSGTKLRLMAPKHHEEYLSGFYSNNDVDSDERLVAFCLDAPMPIMRWPTVYFASLAESLLARGFMPVLVGVKSDRKIAVEIGSVIGQSLPSCFSDELSRITSVLSMCTMAVGGDSGLTYMSSALGTPTVLINGPTDPRRFHFEDHERVLTAKVKCRPCSLLGNRRNRHCPESHHDCMRLISPERVLDALRLVANFQTPVSLPAQAGEGETSGSDGVPLR